MIAPGTGMSLKGLRITKKSTETDQRLYLIAQILDNQGGILTAILGALGGPVAGYNTVTSYDLGSGESHTFTTGTVHALSFSVIQGEAEVSFDGGGTSVTYPVGYNDSVSATTVFDDDIIFTVASGSNRVIVQTVS